MVKLEKGDTLRGMNAQALAEAATELSATARNVLISADSLLSPQAIQDIHATTSILPGSAEQLRSAFIELRLSTSRDVIKGLLRWRQASECRKQPGQSWKHPPPYQVGGLISLSLTTNRSASAGVAP